MIASNPTVGTLLNAQGTTLLIETTDSDSLDLNGHIFAINLNPEAHWSDLRAVLSEYFNSHQLTVLFSSDDSQGEFSQVHAYTLPIFVTLQKNPSSSSFHSSSPFLSRKNILYCHKLPTSVAPHSTSTDLEDAPGPQLLQLFAPGEEAKKKLD